MTALIIDFSFLNWSILPGLTDPATGLLDYFLEQQMWGDVMHTCDTSDTDTTGLFHGVKVLLFKQRNRSHR